MRLSTVLLIAIILIVILPGAAAAEVFVQHDSQWLELLNTRHSGILQAFDSRLGTLTGWQIGTESNITGWIDFYNSDSVAHDVEITVTGWFALQTSAGGGGDYQSIGHTSKTISLSLPAYTTSSPISTCIDIQQNTATAQNSPDDLVGTGGYISLGYTGMGWIEYKMQNAPISGVNANLRNWTCTTKATAYYQYTPTPVSEPSALMALVSGIIGTAAVTRRRK
jgi:hypothetical protein